MAKPEHLRILRQGVEAWNEWRLENRNINPDLSGADVSAADLRGANLGNADLRGANLSDTDLSGANLGKADLRGAKLSKAGLIEANLSAADMTQANLAQVMFADGAGRSATVKDALLVGAHFTRRGEGDAFRSFLDLATAEGLETADFGDPDFLPAYLAEAFEYAHQPELLERWWWPKFVDKAISRIKLLRKLYPDAQPPPALVEAVRAISAELIKHLANHPEELYNIRPRQFEELIAEILASYGWEVQLTPATRDGGYDLFAIAKDAKTATQTSWIIECKKYAADNKVGIDIVRGLYGLKCELRGVGNAMLATTSDFSRDAKKYKASRYDLTLKNYRGILEWINTYRPNPDGKLYIKDNKLIVPGQD